MKKIIYLLIIFISSCSIFDETTAFAYFADFSNGLIKVMEENSASLFVVEDPESVGFASDHQVFSLTATQQLPINGTKSTYYGTIYISYFTEDEKAFAVVQAEDIDVNAVVGLPSSDVDIAKIYAIVDLKSKFVVDGYFHCTSGDLNSHSGIRFSVANLSGCLFPLTAVASE
ncbi:MAG: hypothetical protein JXR63_03590 [Spirochaetales bacterium]|nr:hypothetical protein [Spirochaetales bacterium]